MKKFYIKINNKKILTNGEESILNIARKNKIDIPSLCYHPDLPVKGNCGLCLVEIKGFKKLVRACSVKARPDMEIKTNTARVAKSRNLNLELLYAEHVNKCNTCVNSIDCQLLKLVKKYKIDVTEFPKRKTERKTYKFGNAVEIDGSQCIDCRSCLDACQLLSGIKHLELKGRGINQEIVPKTEDKLSGLAAKKKGFVCIYCGQCALHCPVGAAQEQDQINELELALKNKSKDEILVAQIAPSVRVSIGEEFGLKPGTVVTGKLVTALKKLGFDAVIDVNFGADITTIVEAQELIDRIKNKKPLPLLTSCCPAWVRYVEYYQPELIKNLTSSRSPQMHTAGLVKTYFAKRNNISADKIKVVSIMPCTAKKYEATRKELRYKDKDLIDFVLTTRETAFLIAKNKIKFNALKNSKMNNMLSEHSGAGAIYGASGGVMESAIRTALHILENKKLPKIDFKEYRGMEGLKEASIKIKNRKLNVAIVNGLANFQKIVDQIDKYDYIEVMTCPGGCIGGGGQPIPTNSDIRLARMKALYSIDSKKKLRKAHENTYALKALHYLESQKIDKQILHTTYSKKNK
ncbi:MAG TPA: [FeFe] hydrogenase, group A [Patescibacteria group bacterium]|nr:[FeFe] hydrogenase, group A [Patescibacteria group bacterium]